MCNNVLRLVCDVSVVFLKVYIFDELVNNWLRIIFEDYIVRCEFSILI